MPERKRSTVADYSAGRSLRVALAEHARNHTGSAVRQFSSQLRVTASEPLGAEMIGLANGRAIHV
jgi:hypothetical protein